MRSSGSWNLFALFWGKIHVFMPSVASFTHNLINRHGNYGSDPRKPSYPRWWILLSLPGVSRIPAADKPRGWADRRYVRRAEHAAQPDSAISAYPCRSRIWCEGENLPWRTVWGLQIAPSADARRSACADWTTAHDGESDGVAVAGRLRRGSRWRDWHPGARSGKGGASGAD